MKESISVIKTITHPPTQSVGGRRDFIPTYMSEFNFLEGITHPPAKAVPLPENPRDILRDRRDFTSFNLLEGNIGNSPLKKGEQKGGCLDASGLFEF